MTNFATSLSFFAQAIALAALWRVVAGRLPGWAREGLLVAVSLLFLAQLAAGHGLVVHCIAYAAVVAAAAAALARVPALNARTLAPAALIAAVVAVLLVAKYRFYTSLLLGWLPGLPDLSGVEWVGLSYMTFRAIDLVVQSRRGREPPRPLAAMAFLLFFPTYLAGPINRFKDFAADLAKPPAPLQPGELQELLLRLAGGVVKVLVLADVCRTNSLIGVTELDGLSRGAVLVGLAFQLAYIYFDFSGYSDVAIGVARLLGVRVPENFNWPMLSRNLQDFWNRWHITFAHWCRDYLYFVLLRALRLRARWLSDLGANLAAIFTTFFFMGAWHGDGLNWLLYGLYHGGGMAVLVAGRRIVPAEMAEKLAASRAFHAASVATTLSFVGLGLVLTHDVAFARAAAAKLLFGS